MKKILIGALAVTMALTMVACGEKEKETNTETTETAKPITTTTKAAEKKENDMAKFGDINRYDNVEQNPVVTMEMEDGGIVKIELYPQIAPTSVENFISLINKGFYEGVIFHRVMPSFMAQGGDPSGDGTGGPGYSIAGEFTANGYEKNNLVHDIGVISMARAKSMDSAGSQFFIVTSETSKTSLDGQYAGFGKVIEGMDEVYKIVKSPVNYATEDLYALMDKLQNPEAELTNKEVEMIQAYQSGVAFDRPINPPVIKKMSVETFGVEYAEPIKLDK